MSRSVAATVAAASLYSRLATFALLVFGARVLTVYEFGALAVAVSIAVGLANTFAAGAGDQLAAQTAVDPRAAWKFLAWSSLTLMSLAVLCSLAASVVQPSALSVLGSAASLCACTAVCMTAMNYLRGAGRVTAGSLVAYALLPTLRVLAIVSLISLDSATLRAVVMAINLATMLAAAIALAIANSTPRSAMVPSAGRRAPSAVLSVSIGTSIAVSWMVLGHGDVTALAVWQGSAAAGQYTPTMRMLEALTALGIGIKFAGTHQILANPQLGLRPRMAIPLLCTYIVSVVLCFLAAPTILALTFGEPYEFNYAVAAILAPAYFLASLATILLQILIARGSGLQVALWTIGVIGLSLVLLTTGAAYAGEVGVALADLLTLLAWFAILLRLEISSRDENAT